jgi:hypothetical protein
VLDPLITLFDKLVAWRRLVFTICGIAIVIAGVLVYESYTLHFRLARIEKGSQLLEQLNDEGAKISTNSNPQIVSIYKGLLCDLDDAVNPKNGKHAELYIKIVCTLIPWFVAAIIIAFTSKLEKSVLGGMFVTVIPLCVIGAWLPMFEHKWINYWVYPWASFFVVVNFLKRLTPASPPPEPPPK